MATMKDSLWFAAALFAIVLCIVPWSLLRDAWETWKGESKNVKLHE
jgi:hypothetical protein